jgi:pimeloyl-ACP methyl ester carboxylesterase
MQGPHGYNGGVPGDSPGYDRHNETSRPGLAMKIRRLLSCIVLLASAPMASSAVAQNAPAEEVTLATKDGVQLSLTYFPAAQRKGTPEAKQATPVVLLHDHKETRAIFNSLAQRLQSGAGRPKGVSFACVTVDLRGHGDSTRQILNGTHINLDAARLTKPQLLAMAALDMEAVRGFLVEKNDAGELNLNKLCLVGAGMGANVAANWALQDWSAPPLAIGKQGQDVKSLVLISPRWSYMGLSLQGPMRFRALKENIAWMLVYGVEDRRVAADANRIYKQLEKFHPDADDAAGRSSGSLQVIAWPDSNLQGSILLQQAGAPLEQQIVNFLVQQVARTQLPWTSRLDRIPR